MVLENAKKMFIVSFASKQPKPQKVVGPLRNLFGKVAWTRNLLHCHFILNTSQFRLKHITFIDLSYDTISAAKVISV
jgi:hypothetical protein